MLGMMDLPGPLVSPEWLADHLGAAGLVVADVRWLPDGSAADRFVEGHVAGAVSFDLDRDLSSPPGAGPGRHPLPPPEAFAATMAAAGIGETDAVVACDDAGGSIAARLWWMLAVTGHRAAVLDGGLAAWTGPVETGTGGRREPAAFTARAWPKDFVTDADGVARSLKDRSAILIDARAPERYRGEVEPIDAVAGHIPGARSAPWAGNLDPETGRFLSPDDLRARFERIGAAGRPVIASCGSGTTACHDVLALQLAGLGPTILYEGSWSDWSGDPSRPVATGYDP
jgi:thiosulfate/3-mercaptopyruvate sulfurtransferase